MISEKDIFDSVFFPDLVEPSKREIIENSPGYKYLLDFYTKIKSELNTPVSSEVKQKLANKISIYRNTQIFRLRSVNENKPRKKEITQYWLPHQKQKNQRLLPNLFSMRTIDF